MLACSQHHSEKYDYLQLVLRSVVYSHECYAYLVRSFDDDLPLQEDTILPEKSDSIKSIGKFTLNAKMLNINLQVKMGIMDLELFYL